MERNLSKISNRYAYIFVIVYKIFEIVSVGKNYSITSPITSQSSSLSSTTRTKYSAEDPAIVWAKTKRRQSELSIGE